MSDWTERIDRLDVALFRPIPSQTTQGDRRSLLAIQRATARRRASYAYLEIGSHLGGSIQPHCLDGRCRKIYSIDARPARQPDDRAPGHVASYEDNSSARMLGLLRGIGAGDPGKIECFDSDASQVDPSAISDRPDILFIDGEHTDSAVKSDAAFCLRVAAKGATVVFHDYDILHPAISGICRTLADEGRAFSAYKLEGSVFAVFFDAETVPGDPHLARLAGRQARLIWTCRARLGIKRLLPPRVLRAVGSAWRRLRPG
jgi:hypothetical protein